MHQSGATDNNRLFWALAEQLKIPLMQIARSADQTPTNLIDIAQLIIELLDSYQLGVSEQPRLDLKPVMVPVLLEEAAHKLSQHAKNYGCELMVEAKGYAKPSMTDPQLLTSAFVALGYGLIEAQQGTDKPQLIFSAHRGHRNLAVGAFGKQQNLSQLSLTKARQLTGRAHQALPGSLASSGAGIFIADRLLQSMSMPLRFSHHGRLSGLASTLIPSRQLELIG